MAKKQYISNIVSRMARPRSQRLRELGVSGVAGSTTVINAGRGDTHTHNNMLDLDTITIDQDRYIYIAMTSESDNGEVVSQTGKVKAGWADVATNVAWSGVTSKPTTLAGFGITDAYTKSQTDSYLSAKLDVSVFNDLFEKVNIGTSSAPVHVLKIKYSAYSEQGISALGFGSMTGSGGGGTSYDRLDSWSDYDQSKAGYVLSALLGYNLHTRLNSIPTWSLAAAKPSYVWNEIGSKPTSFTPSSHTHANSDLTGLATWALAATKPVYSWSEINGKPTSFTPSSHTHSYAGSSAAGGAATSANKLNTDAGSLTKGVYFKDGIPVACTYSVSKDVPSDAVFTDTVYAHPAHVAINVANTDGKVLSAIAVNALGHVTSVSHKTLAAADIPVLAIAKITGLQAALDAKSNSNHTHTFASLTSKPTTLAGFGITDAYTKSQTDSYLSAKLDVSVFNNLFEKVNVGTSSAPVYVLKIKYSAYSEQGISALGLGSVTGGGGGSNYNRLDSWSDYSADKAGYVLSALLGENLRGRVALLEGGSATTVNTTGTGNAITAITKSGTVITATKGSSFILEGDSRLTNARVASDVYSWAKASTKPSYSWSEIGSKPTTFAPSAHTHTYSQLTGTVPTWNQDTTGNAASSSYLKVIDNRGAERLPGYYPTNKITAFFNEAVPGAYTTWASGITVKGWTDSYASWQLFGYASSGANDEFYLRSSLTNGTLWNTARKIWHSGNSNNFSSNWNASTLKTTILQLAHPTSFGNRGRIEYTAANGILLNATENPDTYKKITLMAPDGVYIQSSSSAYGTLRAATFTGNLVGNVTGNITGSSGSCTGNAATVTNGVYTNNIQTITAKKTFSVQQAFTVAQGTSPFTVTSNTKVSNLNADFVDGRDVGVSNGQVSYNIPFPSWNDSALSTYIISDYAAKGHPNEEYFKAIAKWAIANYAGSDSITLIGRCSPNSSGTLIMHLYSGSGFDAITKLPRYCTGTYNGLSSQIQTFSTGNYIWKWLGDFQGNATTATRLASTTQVGSASLPVFFGTNGIPVACTASSIFSNLSNSGNSISITIAGHNKTLTPAYATNSGTSAACSGNAATATKLASISTTFTGEYPMTVNVNGTIYSHTGITYTGSTGVLKATTFKGALDGNASTASKLNIVACRPGTNSKAWDTIKINTASTCEKVNAYDVYNDGGPTTYGNILELVGIASHWQPQLWFDSGQTGTVRFRNKNYNNNTWGNWQVIARTTDNVASATKLATARTLWGQSFDGSANVSGALSSVTSILSTSDMDIAATSHLRLRSGSRALILNTSNQFKPYDADNNLIDLGSTTARWKSLYSTGGDFDGTVKIGSTRTITLTNGALYYTADTGGWAMTYGIRSKAGASIGGFGSYGAAEVLTYNYIGATYDNPSLVVLANGNVGIGTVSPSVKLSVSGDIRARGATFTGAINSCSITPSGTKVYDIGSSTNWFKDLYVSNINSISATFGGLLCAYGGLEVDAGIVVTGNSEFYDNISCYGSITANGSMTCLTSSDMRLKSGFTYENYQDRLLALGRVVDYNYTDGRDNIRHTGLIYQQVATVMPSITHFDGSYGAINYISPELICTIAGAVQMNIISLHDLTSKSEDITLRVGTLERENIELKNKINELQYGKR